MRLILTCCSKENIQDNINLSNIQQAAEIVNTPVSKKKKLSTSDGVQKLQSEKMPSSWIRRRRPAAPTALASSDITKKYCELADAKLEIAALQKQSLMLDIKLKEQQLKNIEEEFNLRKKMLESELQK